MRQEQSKAFKQGDIGESLQESQDDDHQEESKDWTQSLGDSQSYYPTTSSVFAKSKS